MHKRVMGATAALLCLFVLALGLAVLVSGSSSEEARAQQASNTACKFSGDTVTRGCKKKPPPTTSSTTTTGTTTAQSSRQVIWGARIDCNGFIPVFCTGAAPFETEPWDVFEDAQHMGKKIGYLQWGVGCFANAGSGQFTAAQTVINRQAIPHMEMMLSKCGGGSWTLQQVANGAADATVDTWAAKIRDFGWPIMIRMWWEPNGPWYPALFDPSVRQYYAPAWHRVVTRVRAIAPNATFLYVINGFNTALNTKAVDPTPWRVNPADVDFVGMDTYRNYPITNISDPAYNWLRSNYPGKPMYWEFGYDHSDPQQPQKMAEVLDVLRTKYLDIDIINFFHRDDDAAGDNLTQATFDTLRPLIADSFYREQAPIGPKGTKVQPLS